MNSRTDIPNRTRLEPREQPLPATDARQASFGRPVLIVLLTGIIIAMLAWVPAEWWGRSQAPEESTIERSVPQRNAPAGDESKSSNSGTGS